MVTVLQYDIRCYMGSELNSFTVYRLIIAKRVVNRERARNFVRVNETTRSPQVWFTSLRDLLRAESS